MQNSLHVVKMLSNVFGCLSRHHSPSVLVPALRTVGNIVTGDDMQTQIIINCGALPCLLNLLQTTHKKSIKKEACWTLSNITAGTKDQIQAVLDAGIIPPLVNLLATAEFDIKKESAWAISNATSGGTREQIKYLVQTGCIRPLCDLLTCTDTRIVSIALEGLENILKVKHCSVSEMSAAFALGLAPRLRHQLLLNSQSDSAAACGANLAFVILDLVSIVLACLLDSVTSAWMVAVMLSLLSHVGLCHSGELSICFSPWLIMCWQLRWVNQIKRWLDPAAQILSRLSLMRQRAQTRLSSFRVMKMRRSMRRLSAFWRHSLMLKMGRLRIWHQQLMPTTYMLLELVRQLQAVVPSTSVQWHSKMYKAAAVPTFQATNIAWAQLRAQSPCTHVYLHLLPCVRLRDIPLCQSSRLMSGRAAGLANLPFSSSVAQSLRSAAHFSSCSEKCASKTSTSISCHMTQLLIGHDSNHRQLHVHCIHSSGA